MINLLPTGVKFIKGNAVHDQLVYSYNIHNNIMFVLFINKYRILMSAFFYFRTNVFATIKLRKTNTNDRSAPKII